MASLHLVTECFADTAFVKALYVVKPEDIVNHAMNIGGVAKQLKDNDHLGYIDVGFVDNDKKNTPTYLDQFVTIEEISSVIFKHNTITNDYLFVLKPALEKFILLQLEEIGKSPQDFNLSNNFKEFVHKLKKSTIDKNNNYLDLLQILVAKQPTGILFIMSKLNELKEKI